MLKRIIVVISSIILPILVIGLILFLSRSVSVVSPTIFQPQQTQLFIIGNLENPTPVDVLATTLPQFAVNVADGKFRNLWQADAAEKKNLVRATAVNAKGDTKLQINTQFDTEKKELIFTPEMESKVKPGLYTLNVKVKTVQGEDITITQDFRWGVLAINTNKGIYHVGDNVKIGMAVLDDLGRTKCFRKDGIMVVSAAKIWLTIKSPSGAVQNLSTEDGSIIGSKSCLDRSVTNDPDFLGQVTPQETGKYTIHMEAQTIMGKESIDDFFTVSSNEPYTIERSIFPTRIYPIAYYPVSITINPHEDYTGDVTDVVPSSFDLLQVSDGASVTNTGQVKIITWHVSWLKDQIYVLSYTIHFPPVTPEFYLVGPLHIGQYSEGREWQIASDSLFLLVQESRTVGNAASPFSGSFGSGVTLNNLLVMHCMRSANNSWSSSISGWSTAFRTSSAAPRVAQYYRVVTSGIAGTTTFSCTATSSPTSGEMAIDLMEYSGTSTSSVLDKAATTRNNRTCNTSSNTTNTIAPVGTDELYVAASAGTTNGMTVSSYTTIGGSSIGFCDAVTGACSTTGGFSRVGGTDSYSSSYGENIGSGTISNQILFSANGTCSNGMAAFKPPLTITQGNYQFYDNINSNTPLTTFNNGATGVSTPITLNQPGQQFRIRMLLDLNSNVGSIALQTDDYQLFYATVSGTLTCATINSGNYNVVGMPSDGTDIAYYQNPFTATSGQNIVATAGLDPADTGFTTQLQSYYQDDSTGPNGPNPGDITNDQNAIANLQSGEWDFSLIDNTDDSETKTYCLELQGAGGSPFDTYNHIPQVTTLNEDVVIRGSPGGTIIRGSPGTNGTKIQ